MKLKVQLQWTDFLNAQLLDTEPNDFQRLVQFFAYSFFAVVFATMVYFFLIGEFGRDEIFLIPMFLLTVFGPFLYRKVIRPKQAKKSFEQLKSLSLPFEIEFTETGFQSSNELGNISLPWDHFTKWNENEDIINLYQYDTIFHIIPKRFFANSQQIEFLKSLLEKNNIRKIKSRFERKKAG